MAAPTAHDKLAEVVEAGTAIARGLDLDETLQAVVEAAARVTGRRYCALGVLGPDRRISRFITTGLTREQRELLGSPPTGRGILGVLIDEARPLRLHRPLGRSALRRLPAPPPADGLVPRRSGRRAAAASSATST